MKKRRFYLTVSVYFFISLADLVLTYVNTPDLSMEANFLVARLGLGWGSLIAALILSVVIFVGLAFYSCCKYRTVYTGYKKFTEYVSSITYDRPDKFWKGGIPKHISPDIAALGFALPWGMSLYRLFCVCEWLTITFGVDETFPFSILRIDYIFIIPSVIITVVMFFGWFYSEFKHQLRK